MEEKKALTIGMAMTEKQGGSDLRANTTIARPLYAHGGGQPYELLGHKFFLSAPMSDAILFWRKPKGTCHAIWCRVGGRMAREIRSSSNGLRIKWAMFPTPRAKWSCAVR